MTLIQKPGNWLSKALGILTGEVPQQLDTQISPVIDVFQQGAGVIEWELLVDTVAAGTAAESGRILVAADFSKSRIVQFGINRVGGAGNAALNVYVQKNPATAGAIRWWQNDTTPTPFNFSWYQEMSGLQYAHLPVGFDLKLSHPGTAAGETLPLRVLVGSVPRGFRIW